MYRWLDAIGPAVPFPQHSCVKNYFFRALHISYFGFVGSSTGVALLLAESFIALRSGIFVQELVLLGELCTIGPWIFVHICT